MAWLAELRKRRIFPFLGAYIAAGFLALEGADQLVDHAIVPGIVYQLVLVLYLFGVPSTAVLAWFHGEKGTQKPVPIELWIQGTLVVLALGVCGIVVRNYVRSARMSVDAATAVGLDPKRIAVLYFDDLSADGELGYLGDGLTEALIDRLSYVRALEVISRNGVAPFRGSDLRRDSIARLLEAGTLIEGSVERAGDKIRVMTRLVDGASGTDIDRRTFELPAGEQLEIGDQLTQEVSGLMRERLGEEIRLRERRAATSNADAWVLVQRAERLRKDAEERIAEDDIEAAFAVLENADSILAVAESLDPTWPEASLLRGQIAYRQGRVDFENWERWSAIAMRHAERTLAMASNHAEALELRGTLEYATWLFDRPADPDEASRLLQRAREDLEEATRIDPTLASAYSTLSHLYYQVEDVPSVVLSARRAYEEDAYLEFADAILWRLFNASLDLEQFSQAVRWCEEGARRFPDNYRFASCRLLLLVTPAQPPDVDLAWQLSAQVDSLTPERWREYEHIDGLMMVGGVLARAGLTDSSRSVLARAHAMVTSEIDPEQALLGHEAYMLTLLGDFDGAVALWKQYAAANPGHFEDGSDVSWWWRDLMSHPEFQRLVGEASER